MHHWKKEQGSQYKQGFNLEHCWPTVSSTASKEGAPPARSTPSPAHSCYRVRQEHTASSRAVYCACLSATTSSPSSSVDALNELLLRTDGTDSPLSHLVALVVATEAWLHEPYRSVNSSTVSLSTRLYYQLGSFALHTLENSFRSLCASCSCIGKLFLYSSEAQGQYVSFTCTRNLRHV